MNGGTNAGYNGGRRASNWRGATPAYGDGSPLWGTTSCAPCRTVEIRHAPRSTRAGHLLAALATSLATWHVFGGSVPAEVMKGHTQMVNALIGAAAPPTEYQKHREAWIMTGDELELERMLRHVAEEYPA